jgi:predicted lipid-binding transport protein (Tim44 family)
MKRLLMLFTLTLITFAFSVQSAEAKRFGMGKSYGYSKKVAPKNYGQPSAPKPSASPSSAGKQGAAQPARSGASRWLGPLAGLAAGGLLAAMLFGDGFQGIQFMDILLFGLIAFILFKIFARRRQAQQPMAQAGGYGQSEPGTPHQAPQNFQTHSPEPVSTSAGATGGSIIGSALSENAEPVRNAEQLPEWFDAESFVEAAKHNFVEVQKAWDAKDLEEIRSYCSPELFSALEKELPAEPTHTEVDTLDAEIADIAIEDGYLIVSVRFSGFIKEEKDGDAHAFNEIWHLRRRLDGSDNWVIIGIQPGHES